MNPTVSLARAVIESSQTVLPAVLGFLMGRPEFLDIALVYALINFVGTIAIMKFFKYSHLGLPHTGDDLGDL